MSMDAPLPTVDNRPEVRELLEKLKAELPSLETLLRACSDMWGYEDPVYRFYHQSFKVFFLQETTERIVEHLQALAPGRKLNPWFMEIIAAGTGHRFTVADNRRWLEVTRPLLEAFFHARYFLEMGVKYGRDLAEPPSLLLSGWGAFLYLYGLR